MVVLRLLGAFLFLIFFQQNSVHADVSNQIYLSIDAPQPELVHDALHKVAFMDWGSANSAEIKKALASGKYRLAVSYKQKGQRPATLTITRVVRESDFEPEQTSWMIQGPGAADQARKLLRQYLLNDAHLPAIKSNLLALGADSSKKISFDENGFKSAETGETLDFSAAAELFQTEKPKNRHWLRMMVEMSLLFGAQEFFYWGLTKAENVVDFDYSLGKRWFRERFVNLNAWHFDDNLYNTNAWRHPAQGALNYIFARSNNFNSLESYLLSFALSSVWEFLGEYREMVSVNDLIVTPAAGSAIGEAFMQLGAFFFRSGNSKMNKILGNIFGSPRGLHDWLDKSKPRHSTRLSNLGFDETLWHEFQTELSAGVRSSGDSDGGTFSRIALDSQIITIPGLTDPGERSGFLFNGNFSQISIRADIGADGAEDFLFYTKSAIMTYFKKKITTEQTSRDGYYFLLGLSTAYEYGMHSSKDHQGFMKDDRIAVAHVLGGSLYLTVYSKGWEIRATVDVFGDFAMLRNFAFNKAKEGLPLESVIKSSIARENYYYGLGFTFDSSLTVTRKNFELGGKATFNKFDSTEGLDRHQDALTQDFDLDDTRFRATGWVGIKFRVVDDLDLKIKLSIEEMRRNGSVLMVDESLKERRIMLGSVLVF